MKCQIPHFRAATGAAICSLLLAVTSVPAVSADRYHDAHQHGVSKLKLVLDGKRLEMELESPGSDIVGFEHAAASDADRRAISDAAARLKKGGDLFTISAAAGCTLAAVDVEASVATDEKKHGKHDHGHNYSHDHGYGHKKGKLGPHDEKASEEGHSAFYAHYQFDCKNPENLAHIDVKFFSAFPRAREIDVQAVTPKTQFRRELTAVKSRLTL